MTRCVLVDVDGTLADNTHRQHFVRSKPRNWPAFNARIHLDAPIEPVIHTVKALKASGLDVVIVTARTADMKEATIKWLHEVADLEGVYSAIYTRDEKDYRDDSIVKMELLDQIIADGYQPMMVLDDRNRVVAAWRARGIPCFQVQPGDF